MDDLKKWSHIPEVYIIRGHGKEYDKNLHIMKRGISISRTPELLSCFKSWELSIFGEGDVLHLWATREYGPVTLYGDVVIFVRYREGYVLDYIGISGIDHKCPELTRKVFSDQRGLWRYVFPIKPLKINKAEKREIEQAIRLLPWDYTGDPLKKWDHSKGIPVTLFINYLNRRETALKLLNESTTITKEASKHDGKTTFY